MGAYHDSQTSTRKISGFIDRYGIRMEEFEAQKFSSFNDFFIRKFKAGARQWSKTPSMSAFAEARYFAWDSTSDATVIPVKGAHLSPRDLLGQAVQPEICQKLLGGPLLLARLCPTDYHRFHFPDSGEWMSMHDVHGKLHSVNPVAFSARPRALLENERKVSILKTDVLGTLAYIEVGALGVGKIVQSHPPGTHFQRGDEKGYFLFGGSTVIVLGEPGKWKPDTDLLQNTARGIETMIRLGEQVALASAL
jgi:phosphatidylserine decarboxylase